MLKYDFNNNNAIVDLPSIWKISRDLILITHAGGTDNMSIPSDGLLTVQVGNIDSIISTSSSNSSYIDNTGNNTGNGGSSSSGNNGQSQYTSDGDTYYSNIVSLVFRNTSGEDAYLTGFAKLSIAHNSSAESGHGDYAPIYFYIDGENGISSGYAKYLVPSGATVTIPANHVHISIDGNESLNWFLGSGVYPNSSSPYYCEVNSWTKQDLNDPNDNGAADNRVVHVVPGTINFNRGGSVEFEIDSIHHNEGIMFSNENETVNLSTTQWSQPSSNNSGNEGGNNGGETTPSGDGINLRLVNDTGVEVRYNGKVVINVSNNPNSWSSYIQINANVHNYLGYNDIIIPAGTSKSVNIPSSHISYLIHNVNGEDLHDPSSYANTNFLSGDWHIMTQAKSEYHYPVFIYSTFCYGDDPSDTSSHSSLNMYIPGPPSATKLINGGLYTIHITSVNSNATLQPNNTGHYVILAENQTGIS